eukprot:CAMPEP_0198116368 /NCGR_PEP_ID=MMETSP1442-20131203/11892_1 /TAXON_ID= /ORGANISM="Craspedostauros australis, Strain CCMP3328" /LENGTH=453 /DNA_ID=CAMNT_0043774163 /DNA_START=107 /DNA_END=1468 /DNA_ORIENTATION=+
MEVMQRHTLSRRRSLNWLLRSKSLLFCLTVTIVAAWNSGKGMKQLDVLTRKNALMQDSADQQPRMGSNERQVSVQALHAPATSASTAASSEGGNGEQQRPMLTPASHILPRFTIDPDHPSTQHRFQDIMNETIVVTGFFHIRGNSKHQPGYFKKGLKTTMRYLRQFQHVYYFHNLENSTDDSMASGIGTEAGAGGEAEADIDDDSVYWGAIRKHLKPEKFTFLPTEFESLQQQRARDLVKLCQMAPPSRRQETFEGVEKQSGYLPRAHADNTQEALDGWTNVINIWISKFEMMRQILQRLQQMAELGHKHPGWKYIVWLDATLLANRGVNRGIQTWPDNRVDDDHVWMRPSYMRFNHSYVEYRAGFILARPQQMEYLIEEFYNHLDWILAQSKLPNTQSDYLGLCYDEESIITSLYNHSLSLSSSSSSQASSSLIVHDLIRDFGSRRKRRNNE